VEQRSWPRTQQEFNEGPIQVRVPTVERIFNPVDPSPLEERSLNDEVAAWIEEWAEDIDEEHVVLEIYVADGTVIGKEAAVTAGLRDHFEYREWSAARRLSLLWRDGLISLAIGLTAMTVFTTASRLIGASKNPVAEVLHEGLLVIGWVSMWKPIEIFLYEWWPIRRELRAYRRLAAADVVFPPVQPRPVIVPKA
jgi:hypothetical protein